MNTHCQEEKVNTFGVTTRCIPHETPQGKGYADRERRVAMPNQKSESQLGWSGSCSPQSIKGNVRHAIGFRRSIEKEVINGNRIEHKLRTSQKKRKVVGGRPKGNTDVRKEKCGNGDISPGIIDPSRIIRSSLRIEAGQKIKIRPG